MDPINMLMDLGLSSHDAIALWESDKENIASVLADLELREKEKIQDVKEKIEKLREYSRSL
jgi:uncharacterized protein YoaH (UPF0181 family)